MRRRTFALLAVVGTLLTGLFTASIASAQEADPLEKVLVFSKTAGFRHDSIPQGIAAIQALGAANGFDVDATEDAAQFTDANLAQYDVVVFLSTTGDVLTDAQQAAFERYIQAGGGYVGIHAAADTEYTWPWYGEMLGGYFPTTRPARRPRRSTSRTPTSPPRPASRPAGPRRRVVQLPAAGQPRASTAAATTTARATAACTCSRRSTRRPTARTTATPPTTTTRSRGAQLRRRPRLVHGDGPHAGLVRARPIPRHLLGGLQTVDRRRDRRLRSRRARPPPSGSDFEIVTLDDDTESPMELDIATDGRVFYVERDHRRDQRHQARRPRSSRRGHDPGVAACRRTG